MFNIPIYRAKQIDSNRYIVGFLEKRIQVTRNGDKHIYSIREDNNEAFNIHTIDPLSIAIHFPGAVDIDRKKIFASIDGGKGIGGDIIHHKEFPNGNNCTVSFKNGEIQVYGSVSELGEYSKVIGIQK